MTEPLFLSHITGLQHRVWQTSCWQHPLLLLSLFPAALTNKFPAGKLVPAWALFPAFTYTMRKGLQATVYNPYLSCPTQRKTFPHELSSRMVSHTLMSRKGSYCSGLMHSQTQWVCRPESYFLLGEVSHCNKAGRGSQGTISTPGRGKWSVACSTLFFKKVSLILFFYFTFSCGSELLNFWAGFPM